MEMDSRLTFDGLDVDVIRKLVAHDDARRELLWLRAREKQDRSSIRSLQRADAALAARMREYEKPALEEHDPRARVRAFQVLHDETYEHWARILTGAPGSCPCGRCRQETSDLG